MAGRIGGHHAAAGNAAVAHLPAMRWGRIVGCRPAEVGPVTLRPSAGCTCWSSLSGLRPVSAGNGEIVVAGGHTCMDSQFVVSPQGLCNDKVELIDWIVESVVTRLAG